MNRLDDKTNKFYFEKQWFVIIIFCKAHVYVHINTYKYREINLCFSGVLQLV